MKKFDLHEFKFHNVTAVHSSRWVEILSASWLCLILVGGTLLNGLIVFVFVRNKHLITVNNVYVLGMVVHNLGLSCLATELPLIAEICGHWLQLLSMNACIFEAFLVYFVGLATMFILVAMAVSRYAAITRPFITAKLSVRHSVLMVVFCDFLALVFSVPPLFGWGSYGLEAHGTSCGLEWRDTSDSFLSYLITITVICLVFPLAAMIFCYTKIYLSVKQTGENCSSGVAHMQASRARKEKLLLKLSISFVLSFLLCWTPYTVVSFYVAYGRPEHIDPLLSRSAALVAKSQVLWNPILYLGITDKFRKNVFDVFRCRKRNTVTELETVASCFTYEQRPGIEPTQTIRSTIQRIFTITKSPRASPFQNVCRRMPRDRKIQQRNTMQTKTSGIEQVTDNSVVNEGNVDTLKVQDEASSSFYSTDGQGIMYSDLISSSSVTDVKPESSRELDESSWENEKKAVLVAINQNVKRTIGNDSHVSKVSTDTLSVSFQKKSPRNLRLERNNYIGDVELHMCQDPSSGEDMSIHPVVTSPSKLSKCCGVVINVTNDNNELIPID